MGSTLSLLFSTRYKIVLSLSAVVSVVGILANEDASTVEDMPPYIQFKFYFWLAVGCVFLCGLILVLNAVLRVGYSSV